MKLNFISLLLLSFLFISCHGQTSNSVNTIDAKLFAEKLKTNENLQLLDVRTPEEYSVEHIGDAKNVNWNGDDFVAKVNSSSVSFMY